MQINISGPYKHDAIARELAVQALGDNHDALRQMESNWKVACASQDITVALAARGGLFEILAANAVLGKLSDFESNAKAVVQWGCKIAESFKPVPELLWVELSLAIKFKDHAARRKLAGSILKNAPSDEFYNLERGQSQALAALVDLDYDAAKLHASRLHEVSVSGEFDRANSRLAATWAKVFSNLARQDFPGCVDDLSIAHKEFLRQINQELQRLARGADSDISVFDMVDWTAGAVVQLVRELGYKIELHKVKNQSPSLGL
jgi:hypothetical protein